MSAKISFTPNQKSIRNIGWSIMQRADDPDINRANEQLKLDIANGATGVALVFEGANTAYGYGLPSQAETIERLFDGVDLKGLHIRLDNQPNGRIIADAFIDYIHQRRIDLNHTKLTFSTDPTAVLATTGKLKMSIEALKASLPQSMSGFFSSGIPGIVLEADGRPYHNAGASPAQELGAMLSIALGHLKMVKEARHHIVYALPHIGFATALDQDPVLGLAKMRAIRQLWRRLQEDRGVPNPFPATIHVETSMRMMSEKDCYTNISRASMASYAAIIGGAHSLTVLPHSFVFGLPNNQARRIAINSQLILAEEGLTPLIKKPKRRQHDADILAEAAWQEFQRFEDEGGVLQSLIDGNLEKRIKDARNAQLKLFAKNEQSIIGTTLFEANAEKPFDILTTKRSHFESDGIVHCKPLTNSRWDIDFLNYKKNVSMKEN